MSCSQNASLRHRSTHAYQAAKVAGLRASAQRRTDQSSHVARTTGATEASLAAQLHAAETRAATVATANSALMAEVKHVPVEVAQQNAAQASLQNGLLAKKLEAASHNAAESALALAAVQKRMEAEKAYFEGFCLEQAAKCHRCKAEIRGRQGKVSSSSCVQLCPHARIALPEGFGCQSGGVTDSCREGLARQAVHNLDLSLTTYTSMSKASSQIASWQKSSQAEAVATRHDRLGGPC
eukprot:3369273-Amphidinium_carterae.1